MRLVLLLPLLLASCSFTSKKWELSFGGKGAASGDGWKRVYDNEKSFSDGAIAGTAIAGLYYGAAVSKAEEATARSANNNATKVDLGAQGVEKFNTEQETQRFFHSTPNPNLQ